MKVWVDRSICDSHGQCTAVAPENFSLNKDGVLEYREDFPDEELDSIEDAIDACPVQAISLRED